MSFRGVDKQILFWTEPGPPFPYIPALKASLVYSSHSSAAAVIDASFNVSEPRHERISVLVLKLSLILL